MTNCEKVRKLHAGCAEIFGFGVLILGASGAGKTDLLLGLSDRGHQFVADESVRLVNADGLLRASPDAALGTHAHARGLGIVDAKDLFGAKSVLSETVVRGCVELLAGPCDERAPGEPRETREFLGVPLPVWRFARASARPIPLLVELAVRGALLKARGRDAEALFLARMTARRVEAA